MSKTVLFQIIQFRISTRFSSIRSMDRTLSGATTPNKSGPESDGSEGVLRVPQTSSITRTSPADCLVLYPGHPLRWGGGLTPLQRNSRCMLQPQPTGQGVKSEFYFSYIGCLRLRIKFTQLFAYSCVGREHMGYHFFPKYINSKWNINNFVKDLD